MLFIVAYFIGLLILPVKDTIQGATDSSIFHLTRAFSGNKDENKNTNSQPVSVTVKPESLNKLPNFPRPKAKQQNIVVWAKEAVVLDGNTGAVLYQNNMLADHQIASLTKVMTAVVLMDIVKNWNEKVSISPHAASAGGATVHFLSGEVFAADDLLKAMLMNSDNTAARALAEHFGGTEDKFVDLMNKKSVELNLRNTHFADAAGLDDEHSHSCAYDLAAIARKAMQYDKILGVMQTPSHIYINSCDASQMQHRVGNTDELLGKYPGIIGAKTGFTYSAGYCLMMMREIPNKGRVVAVLLDAGEHQRWTEMQKLLDWTFDSFFWSVMPKNVTN